MGGNMLKKNKKTNKTSKKGRLAASTLLISLGILSYGYAAAPVGPYVLVGGGGAFLSNSKLGSTTVSRRDIDPFTSVYSISYQQKNAPDYTGRAAFGYLFPIGEAQTQSLGLELGYNYFGPLKSRVNNTLFVPLVPGFGVTENVLTAEKTTAWSTDLAGIYALNFSSLPNTSFIIKLGVGYENKTHTLTNTVTNLTGVLPATQVLSESGLGVAGGLGVQYAFNQNIALRAEVDGLQGKKGIGDTAGLIGLVWSFGS